MLAMDTDIGDVKEFIPSLRTTYGRLPIIAINFGISINAD
jgi:hypothetical protein